MTPLVELIYGKPLVAGAKPVLCTAAVHTEKVQAIIAITLGGRTTGLCSACATDLNKQMSNARIKLLALKLDRQKARS